MVNNNDDKWIVENVDWIILFKLVWTLSISFFCILSIKLFFLVWKKKVFTYLKDFFFNRYKFSQVFFWQMNSLFLLWSNFFFLHLFLYNMKSKLNLVLDKKIGYQFSLSYNIFNKNDFLSQKKNWRQTIR